MFCRTLFDEGDLLEFANLGSYLEYDLFGVEVLNYPFNLEVDMPSDSQRVKAWVTLLSENIFYYNFFPLKHNQCYSFYSHQVLGIISSFCS